MTDNEKKIFLILKGWREDPDIGQLYDKKFKWVFPEDKTGNHYSLNGAYCLEILR
jgi:hypothetical protein